MDWFYSSFLKTFLRYYRTDNEENEDYFGAADNSYNHTSHHNRFFLQHVGRRTIHYREN